MILAIARMLFACFAWIASMFVTPGDYVSDALEALENLEVV